MSEYRGVGHFNVGRRWGRLLHSGALRAQRDALSTHKAAKDAERRAVGAGAALKAQGPRSVRM